MAHFLFLLAALVDLRISSDTESNQARRDIVYETLNGDDRNTVEILLKML
jgi:hypothetical protein